MSWLAAGVHIVAQWLLYGTSSQFHRRLWMLPTYNRLKRCDHSAIFLLAAGSSTPAALLVLRDNWGVGTVSAAGAVLLAWAWIVALTGVAHSLFKPLSGRVNMFGLVWMGQNMHRRTRAEREEAAQACIRNNRVGGAHFVARVCLFCLSFSAAQASPVPACSPSCTSATW